MQDFVFILKLKGKDSRKIVVVFSRAIRAVGYDRVTTNKLFMVLQAPVVVKEYNMFYNRHKYVCGLGLDGRRRLIFRM